ncbi:SDR family oxidoreductase [Halomonas cerina]|uniref:Short-subunit dehydrogenase n=1 Tax=Halomonas cerina TaxID=447424 RepID=A0A839V798_9GAMM|nr:SDR family oxidoreductase [Halomonas cerina]MBB3189399.1 short-subunit dehydrogenase [Halomonas cerina]
MNSLKRVVIIGATSTIAEHTARQLVEKGASLYCIGRNPDKLQALLQDLKVRAGDNQRIDGCVADLLDVDRHDALIETAEQALGGMDAVLIAHGTLPDQQACQRDVALMRREVETNALSVISLLTLLGNRFEQQGAGVIAAIGSVAGNRGRQSNYVYGAAKGMVAIFLQGLRNRLAAHGVDVVTLKPGFVATPMTADFDRSGPLWAQPQDVARGIIKAMIHGRGETYLPGFWRWIMLVITHIPEPLFKRMTL